MSTTGLAVVRYLDEAEQQIVVRRERACLQSIEARTPRQRRRANKRVARAFALPKAA